MKKVALKIAYIGTDFYGFQRQPDQRTVEGELISSLKDTGLINDLKECGYSIAGRTDRGVHALGNVISFRTEEDVKINLINDLLPKSIRILGVTGVPFGFKPRFAKSRHYRYIIPHTQDMDLDKIKSASRLLVGTHDFSNFSKRSERNPVRTVKSIETVIFEDLLIMDITGESFLWNMVRKIATSLFKVGSGKLSIPEFQSFLDPLNCASIAPMPPEGLILIDTIYEGIKFKYDEYARKKFLSVLEEEYMYNRTISAAQRSMINALG